MTMKHEPPLTADERLDALEASAMAHEFMMWQLAQLVASIAPDPADAADRLRTACREHFASLSTWSDPVSHQDFEQCVENILGNAFGEPGTPFMPESANSRP